MLGSERAYAAGLRRRRQRKGLRRASVCLAAIALAGVACAGSRPEAARPDPIEAAAAAARETSNHRVFVMAVRQKPRIVESLTAAGILVSPDLLEAGFTLRVSVGIDQGWKSCGTRNNVEYSLRRKGVIVSEFVQKGWTQTCTPNVFDVLSRQLAEALVGDDRSPATPREP